jgi:hypothetical protein
MLLIWRSEGFPKSIATILASTELQGLAVSSYDGQLGVLRCSKQEVVAGG